MDASLQGWHGGFHLTAFEDVCGRCGSAPLEGHVGPCVDVSMTSSLRGSGCITDAHLCLRGPSAHGSEPSLADFFARLAATLASRGVRVLVERVYGPAECRPRILAIREQAYAHAGLGEPWPGSYQHGRVDDHVGSVGVQLWAVGWARRGAPSVGRDLDGGGGATLRTVRAEGCSGRLLEGPDARVLWLSCVDGRDGAGQLVSGRTEQAALMFERARSILAASDFHYRHVVRTWIQLKEILQWYGPFNEVRSRFHHQQGIGSSADGHHGPASTGVQGAATDEHCVMDLLAVQPRGAGRPAELVTASSVQGDARAYGSDFARAALLRGSSGATLLVSGTASIDLDGVTLHAGDSEAQARQTVRAVASLLAARGAGWSNVVAATLYGRDRAALRAFDRVAHRLGIDSVPIVPVLADLCREDLALELDAVAQCPPEAVLRQPEGGGAGASGHGRAGGGGPGERP